MKGLEIVKSTRTQSENLPEVEVSTPPTPTYTNGTNPIVNEVANNFPKILELVESMAELKKMKVQSEAVLAQMEAERKMLIAETDAYCRKMETDNARVLGKLDIIRQMMADYNKSSKETSMSEEAFRGIITQVIEMEK